MDSNMKNEDFLYKAGNDLSDHEMDLDALDYGLDEPTFAELAQNEKISADANEIENIFTKRRIKDHYDKQHKDKPNDWRNESLRKFIPISR